MNQLRLDLQPANQSYLEIPLTQGQYAKVSPEDYEWLMQWKWCAAWDKKNQTFYAIRSQYRAGRGPKCVRMHREIAKAPDGRLVDHRNHDTLDNQRHNIRVATDSQNCANRKVSGKSGLKGVQYRSGKWRAQIKKNGKKTHLGTFETADLAHAAYIKAAKEIYGEFAYIAAH